MLEPRGETLVPVWQSLEPYIGQTFELIGPKIAPVSIWCI